jgi:hypothetical protein
VTSPTQYIGTRKRNELTKFFHLITLIRFSLISALPLREYRLVFTYRKQSLINSFRAAAAASASALLVSLGGYCPTEHAKLNFPETNDKRAAARES